jgi:hypothetical protein
MDVIANANNESDTNTHNIHIKMEGKAKTERTVEFEQRDI